MLAKQVLQNDPVQVGPLKPGFAFGLPEYPSEYPSSTHRVALQVEYLAVPLEPLSSTHAWVWRETPFELV